MFIAFPNPSAEDVTYKSVLKYCLQKRKNIIMNRKTYRGPELVCNSEYTSVNYTRYYE